MPSDLEQVASHDVPLVGHPLHRHGLHRRLRLPRAQHGAGPTGPGEATPKTHPRLLLTPLLDGIRHNGTVRPTGTLSFILSTYNRGSRLSRMGIERPRLSGFES